MEPFEPCEEKVVIHHQEETPVIQEQTSIVQEQTPVIQGQTPIIQEQTPVQTPVTHQEQTPAVEPEAHGNALQFQAFASAVDASFWRSLAQKKLDEYKLSDSPQGLFGHYGASRHVMVGALFNMGDYSFHQTPTKPLDACPSPVTLINCNTMEAFKAIDKVHVLTRIRECA